MAINTQKLLPQGKLTAAERMAASYDRRVDDVFNFQVKEKLIDVDKFLKKDSKEKKKRVVKGKLTKTRKKREKKEKDLETPKGPGNLGFGKVKSLIPKTGILDAVQRFATFTFLGYLLTKFEGETPKLLKILQKTTPILSATEKIIGGIFEGVVGFIDAGYKAYDQMRALSKDIGGEKAQKVYDDFSTNFNRFLNAVLTFGLSELGRGDQKPPEAKSTGGMVRGYARGGQTTRGGRIVGGSIKRTFKPQTTRIRPQKVQPEKVNPGKDVGGKLKIEKLYPNPKPTAGKRKPNPYKTLTGVSDSLDKGGWIGQLMSAGVKIALGQKVNADRIAKSVSGGVTSLSQAERGGFDVVTRSILGMADGGLVSTMGQNGQIAGNLLATLIQSRVNDALRNVTEELIKIGGTETEPSGGAAPGAGGASGPVPDAYISEDNKKAEADLLDYFSSIYGKNAAVGIVANLWRESGLRTVAPESGFYGMAQWDDNRWAKFSKWAKDSGKDPLSRSAQAQYVAIELKQLGTDNRLKAAKTAEEAASIFYNEFERGSHSRPVVGSKNYDPNNEHEQKNRGYIQQINKRNVSFVSDKIEGSKLSSNILEFRKWRKQNYGVSDQRIASDQTGFLQIRELGKRGRGLLSTEVSKFADDLSYQWWEHSGAGHKENRAFDVPVSDLKMGDRVNQFWRARGYTTIWRSSGHYNHVHVEVPANKAEEFFKIAEKKTKTKTKEDKKLKPKPKIAGGAMGGKRGSGAKMQGGGFVGSQRRNYSSLSSYPSYDTSNGTMIAIQPIIIEKPIPMPMGGTNQTIVFPVPVSVNNNMASLSRA